MIWIAVFRVLEICYCTYSHSHKVRDDFFSAPHEDLGGIYSTLSAVRVCLRLIIYTLLKEVFTLSSLRRSAESPRGRIILT